MTMETKMLDAAWQFANEALKKNKILKKGIMLYGGEFRNERQKEVAKRFLLDNDEFVKVTEKLAMKTEECVAIVPGSEQSPGVFMQIFKMPKLPFDFHFVKDKEGNLLFEQISGNCYPTDNIYAVKKFINIVKEYLNNLKI